MIPAKNNVFISLLEILSKISFFCQIIAFSNLKMTMLIMIMALFIVAQS